MTFRISDAELDPRIIGFETAGNEHPWLKLDPTYTQKTSLPDGTNTFQDSILLRTEHRERSTLEHSRMQTADKPIILVIQLPNPKDSSILKI